MRYLDPLTCILGYVQWSLRDFHEKMGGQMSGCTTIKLMPTLNQGRTSDNPRISQYPLRRWKHVPCIEACVWSGCGWVCRVSERHRPAAGRKSELCPARARQLLLSTFIYPSKYFCFYPVYTQIFAARMLRLVPSTRWPDPAARPRCEHPPRPPPPHR